MFVKMQGEDRSGCLGGLQCIGGACAGEVKQGQVRLGNQAVTSSWILSATVESRHHSVVNKKMCDALERRENQIRCFFWSHFELLWLFLKDK